MLVVAAMGRILKMASCTVLLRRLALHRYSVPTCSKSSSANYIEKTEHDNDSIKPLINFVNKNPRNLERLSYSAMDCGWGLEGSGYAKKNSANMPKRKYYHRLILYGSNYHSYAEVEHHTGEVIISANTTERCIKRHLYKFTDVSACSNLGRVVAQRCLRAGISCVALSFPSSLETNSESVTQFKEATSKEGLCLEEPSNVRFDYTKPYEIPKGPVPPQQD